MDTTVLVTVVNDTSEEETIDDVKILAKTYTMYRISKYFHLYDLVIIVESVLYDKVQIIQFDYKYCINWY